MTRFCLWKEKEEIDPKAQVRDFVEAMRKGGEWQWYFGDPPDKGEHTVAKISRHLGIYRYSPELLFALSQGTYRIVNNPIPEGAQPRSASYDLNSDSFCLVVSHPSFPEVLEGNVLPFMDTAEVERIDTPDKLLVEITVGEGQVASDLVADIARRLEGLDLDKMDVTLHRTVTFEDV